MHGPGNSFHAPLTRRGGESRPAASSSRGVLPGAVIATTYGACRPDPGQTFGRPVLRSYHQPPPARLFVRTRRGFENAGEERVNDLEIIQRCRVGDREAQRQVFEKTSPRVYRLLLRMTGNPDDALDLAQETFVKGFQRLDQFDGRSAAIATWFYRIAVNEALQFRRRQSTGTLKLQARAPRQRAEARRPTTDLRLDMEDALARLPPDDRALLLLRYQEGLDYRAIAEVLECAEGTVASRLNRARERLRGILRRSYG